MRRNVAAGIGSNEQGEYCRVALQRSDRKELRYKWPTLLYFIVYKISRYKLATRFADSFEIIAITRSALFNAKCTTNSARLKNICRNGVPPRSGAITPDSTVSELFTK